MAKENQDKNKEKLKALQLTLDKIERSYGKGAIMLPLVSADCPKAG